MSKEPPRIRRKPRGVSGAFAIGPNGIEPYHVELPIEKFQIEALLLRVFLENYKDREDDFLPFVDPEQNEENAMDFSVNCAKGSKNIEMVEFAPLDKFNVKFENAPRDNFRNGEFVQLVIEMIEKKDRYQSEGSILLVYTTHSPFSIGGPIEEILRRRLAESPPPFERVYYVKRLGDAGGAAARLFPSFDKNSFPGISTYRLTQGSRIGVYPDDARIVGGNIVIAAGRRL